MEWTKRELQSIEGPKIGMIDTVIGNIHGGLSKIGVLERNGSPTAIGRIVTDVLGHTRQQRSKDTPPVHARREYCWGVGSCRYSLPDL
jgi:hypothetical protein